jgi:Domain of unknown function (DUF4920)
MKLFPVVLLLALTACAGNSAKKEMNDSAAGLKSYGADMPAEPKAASSVAEALSNVETIGNTPLKISGRIGKVCQAKGCWMMLTQGDQAIRVKFGDDAFFIPKDSVGDAIAYGVLAKVELDAKEVNHMIRDGVEDKAPVTVGAAEYQMNATAVQIKTE